MRISLVRITRRAVVASTIITFIALAGGAGVAAASGAAKTGDAGTASKGTVHTVKMKGMNFVPADLKVAVGDTVVWVNEDVVPHTATATKDGVAAFDSGNLQAGEKWSYVAEKAGKIPYVCLLHPMMKGTLTVR